MIYFDNAATGGFKPNIVKESVKSLLDDYQVNVGRGSYDTAVFAEERVFECRRFLSNNLNNSICPNQITKKGSLSNSVGEGF